MTEWQPAGYSRRARGSASDASARQDAKFRCNEVTRSDPSSSEHAVRKEHHEAGTDCGRATRLTILSVLDDGCSPTTPQDMNVLPLAAAPLLGYAPPTFVARGPLRFERLP